jgi:hypothetical protein
MRCLQEGKILGLRDHLFGELWEAHNSKLRDIASEVGNKEHQRRLGDALVGIHGGGGVRPSVFGFRSSLGRGRGTPPSKVPLKRGGYTLRAYPGAQQEPLNCCRGWWADGLCNAQGGVDRCPFQHEAHHKGKALAHING